MMQSFIKYSIAFIQTADKMDASVYPEGQRWGNLAVNEESCCSMQKMAATAIENPTHRVHEVLYSKCGCTTWVPTNILRRWLDTVVRAGRVSGRVVFTGQTDAAPRKLSWRWWRRGFVESAAVRAGAVQVADQTVVHHCAVIRRREIDRLIFKLALSSPLVLPRMRKALIEILTVCRGIVATDPSHGFVLPVRWWSPGRARWPVSEPVLAAHGRVVS